MRCFLTRRYVLLKSETTASVAFRTPLHSRHRTTRRSTELDADQQLLSIIMDTELT